MWWYLIGLPIALVIIFLCIFIDRDEWMPREHRSTFFDDLFEMTAFVIVVTVFWPISLGPWIIFHILSAINKV